VIAMNKCPKLPKRKNSLRLKGYDYSQEGMYFVTICTYNYETLFNNKEFANIVEKEWLNTATLRPKIELDKFIVMPDHIHGIIFIKQKAIKSTKSVVGAYCCTPALDLQRANVNSPLHRIPCAPSQSLGSIIRGFKSSTTKKINKLRQTPGVSVWQRSYYDHVIRDERDLYKIRKYIIENVQNCEIDEENPVNF